MKLTPEQETLVREFAGDFGFPRNLANLSANMCYASLHSRKKAIYRAFGINVVASSKKKLGKCKLFMEWNRQFESVFGVNETETA
jgi:hypothetical protein